MVGLGNGFYNEETIVDWAYDKADWRDRPKLLCQVYVKFTNGTDTLIVSDTSWQVHPSQVIRNSIFAGEMHDYSIDYSQHNQANMRNKAILAPAPVGRLKSQIMPLEILADTFRPASVARTSRGPIIIDAGINLSGRLKINFDQTQGDTIEIRYGEMLMADGSVDQSNINRNTLDNIQTDVVIFSDSGQIAWEPKYVYHGFQYAEIRGYKGWLTTNDAEVRFIHTNLKRTGQFTCSNNMINKLQKATIQSYLSNYHGYPTDCPQREKNGWTADAHLAARTGLYNFNMNQAFEKWMGDIKDAQLADGKLPGIVPTSGWGYQIYHEITDPMGPAWDAAYTLIPWYTYLYTGNTHILKEHYEGMKKHAEYIRLKSPEHIAKYGLSDWAHYKTPTHWEVTSTYYYALIVSTLHKIATVLDQPEDAKAYGTLYGNIKDAFNKNSLMPIA
ncbi:MAG: family 78 glycoside hydrolase catalytic domain [Bacteroidales bacterium]|nr:family 78 glycoside hydrolase catalytic domain [Bacteroidales bacterium]